MDKGSEKKRSSALLRAVHGADGRRPVEGLGFLRAFAARSRRRCSEAPPTEQPSARGGCGLPAFGRNVARQSAGGACKMRRSRLAASAAQPVATPPRAEGCSLANRLDRSLRWLRAVGMQDTKIPARRAGGPQPPGCGGPQLAAARAPSPGRAPKTYSIFNFPLSIFNSPCGLLLRPTFAIFVNSTNR